MNKKELIKAVATKTGFSQKDITEVVDVILGTISDTLVDGNEVNIAGFGKFLVQERAAREGVKPRTGEALHIEASKTPKFKAGKALKDAVK
jgi:DNA-binding protein HU-beta